MAKLKSTHVYGTLTVDEALTVATDAVITGNLTVNGSTSYTNVVTTTVLDPIVEYGGGADNAALLTDDNKDRGSLLHYFDGVAKDAFIGWKNADSEFIVASNVTITDNVVTVGDWGNVHAGWFIGEGSSLANVTGANVTGYVPNANHANVAGYVDQANQSNITSVGTLTGLTVSGTSNVADINANGVVNVTNTTASTSTTDGALVVAGGVGIGGNLWVGGTLHANVSGTTSAPGSNTQVQFNDNGTSNATGGLTFNKTSNTLTVGANVSLAGDTGVANIGGNINLGGHSIVDTNSTGIELKSTSYAQLNYDNTSYIWADASGAHLESSGGNVKLDNNGDLSVDTGNLTLPNADISATGTANLGDALNVANTANVGSVIARDIAETQVPFAGVNSKLTGSSDFVYATGASRLTVPTANIANVNANTIKSSDLTSGRLTFATTNGQLTDDANLRYDGSSLFVTTANTSRVETTNANVTSLTSTGLVIAGTNGALTTDTNVQYASNTLTVTGNVAAGAIKTDSLLYANGVAWDLQEAAGSDNQIQYNVGNNFAASSAFTFNDTTKTLTVGNGMIGNVIMTGGNLTTTHTASVGGELLVTGNANVTSNLLVSESANVVVDLRVGGNTNIVGTLEAGDTTITGNLTVTGTTTSVNTTVTQLSDPLFDLGNGADGAALTTNDGMDRGLVMHTYVGANGSGTTRDLFMGWDSSNTTFVLAKNVSVTDNVVDYGATDVDQKANLADLILGNVYAYNANFGGVVFANGNVTLGAGSSFVGNLSGNVSGDFSGNISGNITVTGGAGAIQFSDASNTLVSSANLNFDDANATLVVGANSATGTVSADFLTGTLTTAAQPNVTSLGTLTGLAIDGNLSIGNATSGWGIKTDNLYYSNGVAWDLQQAAGSNTEIQFNDGDNFASSSKFTFDTAIDTLTVDGTANVTGTVNAADVTVSSLTAGRVVFNDIDNKLVDSANLTFDATSNTLTTTTANVATINSDNIVNTADITSGNVYANAGTVKATNLTGTLTTAAQGNITSVGELTGLTVRGIVDLADIGNLRVNGGSSGQVVVTDGAGNLSFATNDTSRIVNGTSNVSIPTADGNINMVSGGTTIVQISGTGANVTGVVTATGNISGNNLSSSNFVTVTGTSDATDANTGSIHTDGGISAKGNIYAGHSVGFADNTGNTASAAYIQFNATANSLDFIFN